VNLDELDYELPEELVAQRPLAQRDAARLLVVSRRVGSLVDRRVGELPALLRPGDLLVRNDSRVFPARAHFRRATGGRVELLFLRCLPSESAAPDDPERWEVLLRGRPRAGEALAGDEDPGWALVAERPLGGGRWVVASPGRPGVLERLERHGLTPLPPYIREPVADPERYQTVYARSTGSAAAPTAGLHFTAELDARLREAGVELAALTLHVGLGTFEPLREAVVEENRLHAEDYELDARTWAHVRAARDEGRRIVAVGSTSVRVLEHLARQEEGRPLCSTRSDGENGERLRGETRLFLTPGTPFRVVDALLTNFHLPRTSLLALVMAFAGVELTRAAYAHAVRERYRFFSFGDAMLVE
jgi:S-adenosylmethionine:tRNA ribosyltransferase-isomerase